LARLAADQECRSDSLPEVAPAFICRRYKHRQTKPRSGGTGDAPPVRPVHRNLASGTHHRIHLHRGHITGYTGDKRRGCIAGREISCGTGGDTRRGETSQGQTTGNSALLTVCSQWGHSTRAHHPEPRVTGDTPTQPALDATVR